MLRRRCFCLLQGCPTRWTIPVERPGRSAFKGPCSSSSSALPHCCRPIIDIPSLGRANPNLPVREEVCAPRGSHRTLHDEIREARPLLVQPPATGLDGRRGDRPDGLTEQLVARDSSIVGLSLVGEQLSPDGFSQQPHSLSAAWAAGST